MHARDLMQGFPPPGDRQVTLANWRDPPYSRWSLQHVREILPSAAISRASVPSPLPRLPLDLASAELEDHIGRRLTVEQVLDETWTDAVVVLHRGQLVFERYQNALEAATPHLLFSVTKSVTGTLAGILVEGGLLDPDAPVTRYLPEVEGSAYGDASVRHVLDMTVGVRFSEDYENERRGDMLRYRMAAGWAPHDGSDAPDNLRAYLLTLSGEGVHGERFRYVSPNSDLLGWVLERASGRSFSRLLSEWLWQPMGAEHEAYITVDRLGAPRTAGGLCASARDFARLGQLMLERGFANARQVVPAGWVEDILTQGDPEAWRKGDFGEEMPGACYRSQWYRSSAPDGALYGLGIHGQCVYVHPRANVVIAKFSSQPRSVDLALDALTFRAFGVMVEALGN